MSNLSSTDRKEDDLTSGINQNDIDACPICFEEWTNSGQHRLVSTQCGHLFGKICIEKWLRTTPHCPHCQSFTRRRDLRRIYCRAIQAIDTSEKDNAIRERDLERKARRILEYEKAELKLAYDKLKEDFQLLQTDHNRLLKLTHRLNDVKQIPDDYSSRLSAPLPSINIQLERIIKIPEGMCRVLAYDSLHQLLFVSQSINNPLNSGYGIKKINLSNASYPSEYLNLQHTKPIRDIQLHGDLILSCSWDKTLRIFDYIKKTLNLICECTSQVWSCSWNFDDPNIIYAGLNTGHIQVFDRRQVQINETNLSSSIETLNFSSTSPILCLQYIQKNSKFNANGLLVGSNEKSGFYEYISNCEYHFHELPIDKNLLSLYYDSKKNYLIASFRPQSNPTRHELYELITKPTQSVQITLQLIQVFFGSSINIILSRTKILHQNFETFILASDNGSHGIELWNVRQPKNSSSFKLLTQCDIVDICLTRQYLCVLADNQIRLYKWT